MKNYESFSPALSSLIKGSKDHPYNTDYIYNMRYKLIKLLLISTIMSSFIIHPAFSLNKNSISMHIVISELKEAQSPMFVDNQILFSYFEGNKYIRRVAIAFGNDNYRKVYPFQKNEYNVFFYTKEIPDNIDHINYRLIVDGVWIEDPVNENSFLSSELLRISRLQIPDKSNTQSDTPIVGNNRNVRFIYKDRSDKQIFLSGNFNNWDPFMLKMEEDSNEPGTYAISLRLSAGKHYYTFISNGVTLADPGNIQKAYDSRGNAVSMIMID
jgi:hypothetical protein